MRTGSCDALGEVEHEIGDLQPAGGNAVTIAASYDDVVMQLVDDSSSIVIMKPDGETVAWCGPA